MKITVDIIQNGMKRTVSADENAPLSAVLIENGLRFDMPCGGKGTCKRCIVRISGEERLACQTRLANGMCIELPDASEFDRILVGNGDAAPKNPMYARYGLSVDIGTTTVCARLCETGGFSETISCKNPQAAFGADVISRIEKSLVGNGSGLAKQIRETISEMAATLAEKSGITADGIDAAVITGNTAMLYLLAEQSPEPLSHAPFEADRLFGETVEAGSLEIGISPKGGIYLPRCMSAFVGGDITTAILASGMCEQDDTALLVDIGTNGELALWHGGRLACCSTAAGPAFEGAGISSGVYGINGAIDRVWIDNGETRCSTIGNVPAVGICGSGIIDALAAMLKLEIIDETGAFTGDEDSFGLEAGVGITAQDVRKIQLAKGSVRAGIETLLDACGVAKSKVKTLYIAGGFGSYINLDNAAAIGLIPSELLHCAKVIGNAAHTGATMLLQDKTRVEETERLAASAHTVPLDANPVFTENYMNYMMFE